MSDAFFKFFSADETSGDPWPPVEPIATVLAPPPFNTQTMLPQGVPRLRDLVQSLAEALQVPTDMVAATVVGLASFACSRSHEVECGDGWREPAPLWPITLMRPGERKSAVVGSLLKPVHAWMTKAKDDLRDPVARYLERRAEMVTRLTELRRRAAKAKDETERCELRRQCAGLAEDLAAMPERVGAPDLIASSYTPEGLRDLMALSGEKLGIVSAEADAAELLGVRYSDAGPAIDLLLAGHAGDPVSAVRANVKRIDLERPAVSFALCVQGEALRTVLANPAARGRGLLDRMLLISPVSLMGARKLDAPTVPTALEDWWSGAVHRLLDVPWPGRFIVGTDGEPVRCTSAPRIIKLSAGARGCLWALRERLEPRLKPDGDLFSMSGFASKLAGAVARMALAFTLLGQPTADEVSGDAMKAAVEWADYLLAHRLAVLAESEEPPVLHHAKRLHAALKRRGTGEMTARELFRLVETSALSRMMDFIPVLELLMERGDLRPLAVDPKDRDRRSSLFAVNPGLLPQGNA